MPQTRVRFTETPSDVLRVIEIDAPLGATNKEAVWHSLFELRTQIVMAECRIVGDRVLHRLHVSDLGGAPMPSA